MIRTISFAIFRHWRETFIMYNNVTYWHEMGQIWDLFISFKYIQVLSTLYSLLSTLYSLLSTLYAQSDVPSWNQRTCLRVKSRRSWKYYDLLQILMSFLPADLIILWYINGRNCNFLSSLDLLNQIYFRFLTKSQIK